MRGAQSEEKVARAISKFTPRSERPKSARGLWERSQNIWEAQGDEMVAREISGETISCETSIKNGRWRSFVGVTKFAVHGSHAQVKCETSTNNGSWRNVSNLCCMKVIKNAAHPGDHLEWTPSINPYRKKPKCGHTVWGTKADFLRGIRTNDLYSNLHHA